MQGTVGVLREDTHTQTSDLPLVCVEKGREKVQIPCAPEF
jgi:hypothetical protein